MHTQHVVAGAPRGVTRTWVPSLLRDPRARVSRFLLQMPLYLYRLQLGWLLGHEFLVLTHVGRHTGRIHQTVLKVLRYDSSTRESIVASAWGERSDWYQNIQAHPAVAVSTGGDQFIPRQRVVPPDEAFEVFRDWVHRERWFARLMLGQIGRCIDVPEPELRAVVLGFPFIGLSPAIRR